MAKKTAGAPAGFAQLKADLARKKPGSFYVLYGEEDYLRRYYLEALRKQLLDELTGAFNFHRLTAENMSLQALSDSLEALPMMAERSMVQVDGVDLFALPEQERTSLAALLGDLPEYCCLVLVYESFQPDKRKKKLWEAIEKNAVLVEFRYQKERDLIAWLLRHFRANGKSIGNDLCGYLLQRCGSSMTRLDAEIEKICAYSGATEIVREDIDTVVEPTLEAVVFEITDALGQREFGRALEKLDVMCRLRAEPIAILGAIGSQMRRLNAARILLGAGKSAADLAEICGIAPYAATKTMAQSRGLSDRFCRRAVLLCRDTDLQLKTSYDEPERLLELLILRLAEEARHD